MRHLRPSWAEAGLVASTIGVGLLAEAQFYGWSRPASWVPDLLTGWAIVACGLVVQGRPRRLLAATGLSWFAGNFASAALLLHRGPLTQLILTYPTGRAAGRLDLAVVAIAYAVSIAGATWWPGAATYALAAIVVLTTGAQFVRAVGLRRRELAYTLRPALLFAVVLAAVGGANSVWATAAERSALLHFYEAGIVAVAAILTYGLLRRPWQRAPILDLVVDIGETRRGDVRDAIAHALGDDTLEVAYRVGGTYVDTAGRPVDLPETGSGRHVTRIERDGAEVAVILHDAAVLDDPALLEGVATATRLAAANARLQAEVRNQVTELEASRRRLLEASDAERRRLEAALQEGALRRLTRLDLHLAAARAEASPPTAASIDAAHAQLTRTSSDLRELAAGLHPRDLVEHGLDRALTALVARSPLRVELKVLHERLPGSVELTLYYICSEALANVWKHADATHVSVTVEREGSEARVEVRDDGVGGARPRSLADRVDAVGGTLAVRSSHGRGTHLLARIPLA